MTVWGPGSGPPEVLSSGHDGQGIGGRRRVAALVAGSLLLGGLLGLKVEQELAPQVAPTPRIALHAGAVIDVPACSRRCLRLPLFNSGRDPVTVTGIGFGHGQVSTDTRTTVVAPDTWRVVRFDLPRDCGVRRPRGYRAVQVSASVAGGLATRSLPMSHGTRLVREQYDLECPRGVPASPPDLWGVWLLQETQSAWHDQVGRLLMRFDDRGGFGWDPRGHLGDAHQAVSGRYRLRHGRLAVTMDTQNLCRTTDVYVWRATVTAPDELNLRHVHGSPRYCGAPEDDVWIARRVLGEERWPETRALVHGR